MRAAHLLVVAAAAIATATLSVWPGSVWPFLAFSGAMILMAALALVGPVSYAYSFLAAFLFLGFWCKLVVHLLTGVPLIEPVGLFDGSPIAWDAAVLVASAAALGVASMRAFQLVVLSRCAYALTMSYRFAPPFYVRFRRSIWVLALTVVLALNLWNSQAAFYQIGVNPRVVLPAHMNVVLAWLINWGFALGVACLVHWEIRLHPKKGGVALMGALVEAASASISSLSRSAYLFHGISCVLAWLEAQRRGIAGSGRMQVAWIVAAFVLGLLATLVAVQVQRSELYFAPIETQHSNQRSAPSTPLDAERQTYLRDMLAQLPWLVVNRWVGLEAVLAVSSHPGKGPALFAEAIRENPKLGVDTIFQRIAGAGYAQSERFTFLTLAGATAVLYYTGSLAVVAVGMAALAGMLLATDALVRRSTGNPFVASLAGISMAYTTTQLTFPYLAAIFFLQLWFTLAAIAFLEFVGAAKSAVSATHE